MYYITLLLYYFNITLTLHVFWFLSHLIVWHVMQTYLNLFKKSKDAISQNVAPCHKKNGMPAVEG